MDVQDKSWTPTDRLYFLGWYQKNPIFLKNFWFPRASVGTQSRRASVAACKHGTLARGNEKKQSALN
ncbi:hypothetical protein PN36_01190 [Candidatus Thiomargarita nelsonii]|uniref:Uncharacterized protein n=1 Tax=Candidatus Thiomargarita nelsonii TaxID=1003181 RepID=A0A0A6PFY1_9GAMM|nr:hypothetical protein PN36_01190 [Candidatus Thiomargarita nelsonii]